MVLDSSKLVKVGLSASLTWMVGGFCGSLGLVGDGI